jgi:hypothetical protein
MNEELSESSDLNHSFKWAAFSQICENGQADFDQFSHSALQTLNFFVPHKEIERLVTLQPIQEIR